MIRPLDGTNLILDYTPLCDIARRTRETYEVRFALLNRRIVESWVVTPKDCDVLYRKLHPGVFDRLSDAKWLVLLTVMIGVLVFVILFWLFRS